jgi:hypothetical protein
MAKYHVNPKTGDPGSCRATKGNCPFASDDEHYTSKEAAHEAFEKKVAETPAPEFSANRVRFQKITTQENLQKLVPQLEYRFKRDPSFRLKVSDVNASAIGVLNVQYTPETRLFTYGRSRMRINHPLKQSESLEEILRYAADNDGYSDDEYDPMDWDD